MGRRLFGGRLFRFGRSDQILGHGIQPYIIDLAGPEDRDVRHMQDPFGHGEFRHAVIACPIFKRFGLG